jgi:hypothetical protein
MALAINAQKRKTENRMKLTAGWKETENRQNQFC